MANEFEIVIQILAAVSGIGAVAIALLAELRQQARPSAKVYGTRTEILTSRPYTLALTVVFVVVMVILWMPVLSLSVNVRLILDITGTVIFFPSIALYLAGMKELGTMFGVSSTFGARLYGGHRLVKSGPYGIIRHPMYLGIICAGIGGLLIFRTYAMLFFAAAMFGLIVRARTEERLLAQEFGPEWEDYVRRVPGWIPRTSSGKRDE